MASKSKPIKLNFAFLHRVIASGKKFVAQREKENHGRTKGRDCVPSLRKNRATGAH